VAEAAGALAALIQSEAWEIERRWLEHIGREGVGDLPLSSTQLRDGIGDYLEAMVAMLGPGRQGKGDEGRNAWATVAREHGIHRARLGFDISQLLRELFALRWVIEGLADERSIAGADRDLVRVIDGAVAEAVAAYVRVRDSEVRSKHAIDIGFLTHELRTPLTAAMLVAARLKRRLPPEQEKVLDTLNRHHRRLADLVESVLLAERLEAGKQEVRATDVTLGELLSTALEAARLTAAQKGVTFEAHYDPNVVLHVDPGLALAAVQNVADNAAKYTDSGRVDVDVEERPDTVVVHVNDQGPGLAPEELSTLFEPFHRGKTSKAGSGLGLAIARRALEVQGGSIHAESRRDRGAHFWLTLPRAA
jgi:signal transduction histidine kinase